MPEELSHGVGPMAKRPPRSEQSWPVHLGCVLCLSLVLGCGLAPAASTPVEDKPAAPPLERAEAQRYAQQLVQIIAQVREKYLKPVRRAELATAALRGLYGAARVPVPPTLPAEVLQAADNPSELHGLAVRIRESLGNPEPLRNQQDFLASLQSLTE